MMKSRNITKVNSKRTFYAVILGVVVVYWYVSSNATVALECVSMGGEIEFGIKLGCAIDFSDQ